MDTGDLPTRISVTFAENADPAYTTTLPTTTGAKGRASWSIGFPPITFQTEDIGGVPPHGADFNALGNAISKWARWQSMGGTVTFDATFASAIGGYAKGSLLRAETYQGGTTAVNSFWLATADDVSTNPNSGASGTTPAGWQHIGFGTTYAGDPNGHVAGTAAGSGGITQALLWDTSNNKVWMCTVSGNAANAVWTAITSPGGLVLPPSGVVAGTYTFTTVTVNTYGIITDISNGLPATVSNLGIVKPDGTTVTIDVDGTLHAVVGGSGTVTSISVGQFLTASSSPITTTGTISGIPATASDVRGTTEDSKILAPKALYDAAEPGTLTDAATIAWNMASVGFNAKVTLEGNRTLGVPTNMKVGSTYSLQINTGTVGNRTLGYSSCWDFGMYPVPVLPTGANLDCFIWAQCYDATPGAPKFICSYNFRLA